MADVEFGFFRTTDMYRALCRTCPYRFGFTFGLWMRQVFCVVAAATTDS